MRWLVAEQGNLLGSAGRMRKSLSKTDGYGRSEESGTGEAAGA